MTSDSGQGSLGRSPLAIGATALAVLAVVLIVWNRAGGEAGAAYGAADGGDCVSVYPEDLAERSWAFDGVVIATGPSVSDRVGSMEGYTGVTFEVREWFAGGSGDAVTVDLASRPGVGARLLVAGEPRWDGQPLEEAVAWESCGYVRYFDPDVADDWRETFG